MLYYVSATELDTDIGHLHHQLLGELREQAQFDDRLAGGRLFSGSSNTIEDEPDVDNEKGLPHWLNIRWMCDTTPKIYALAMSALSRWHNTNAERIN